MTKTNQNATSISSRTASRRLGCLALIGYLACLGLLALGAMAALGGCATAPDRWEALSVAGTGHTTVFQSGLPRPRNYTAIPVGTGLARFYRNGVYVGTGTHETIEPYQGTIRIEVSRSTRVQITGQ